MPIVTEDMDSAFQTAGANPGLEVWCIENQRLVSVSNSSHGKLYTGSAYLVFNVRYCSLYFPIDPFNFMKNLMAISQLKSKVSTIIFIIFSSFCYPFLKLNPLLLWPPSS
ncbi:hypothetical protein GLYMA_20G038302v4 [Glycine max]|nr:hypothetical protein GLYMA_20G038302v4 [Glycine max]KAH1034418.1 hypothetical protein GYH30_054714 [Glycine max]